MQRQKKIVAIFAAGLFFAMMGGIFARDNRIEKSIPENKIFETSPKTALPEAVSFISPHHLVARKLIENIFQKTAQINKNHEIKKIVLISPNHNNIGRGWAVLADNDWEIEGGKIDADKKMIRTLAEEADIFSLDNEAFEQEHGIKNLLPFAKKYFPQAEITPIMLRDGLSSSKAEKIANLLADNSDSGTVVILSADFSHYIGQTASEMHDQISLDSINNFNYKKISRIDIDCRGGLEILLRYSEKLGRRKFNFLEKSSSSEIYGRDFGSENTSYLTGYFSQGKGELSFGAASFMFFGDLMLDRGMRPLLKNKGVDWPTKKIHRLFWGQDFNVANLESAVTSNPSVSINSRAKEKEHFSFTSDPETTASFLKSNHINILSLANNHTDDFGEIGAQETENYLREASVDYFGSPLKKDAYLVKEINNKKIAFIAYNRFGGAGEESVAKSIKKAKSENDLVVLMAHWGTEYAFLPDEKQIFLARQFIDAGADLIIGSHPHVVQPVEIYKNKAVFYSLGNFVFDQNFSEEVKIRLALGIIYADNKLSFYLIPLYLERNGQLAIMQEEKRKNFLEKIAGSSKIDISVKNSIIKGNLQLFN